MANPDKPRGFKFVKSLSGAPVSAMARSIGVTSGTDLFVGDLLQVTSNLAAVGAPGSTTFLGVAIGFGKVSSMQGEYGGAFNPDNLTTLYYDDSASTSTEWRVWYIPVDDAVFEVQTDSTTSGLAIGDACDMVATTAGSTVTGRSGQELDASSNADMHVVDVPPYPDNDASLVNATYHVTITKAEMVFQ